MYLSAQSVPQLIARASAYAEGTFNIERCPRDAMPANFEWTVR